MAKQKPDLWLPLYVGDYLADTTRLTLEQHGAYLLLILDYWRSGPPPDDDTTLAGIVRSTPAVWRRLRPVLGGFFQVADGRWHHKRIDLELATARERKAKAEQKAREAAEKRWGKRPEPDARSNAPSNARSIAQAMLEQCPSPSPSPKKTLPSSPEEGVHGVAVPLSTESKVPDCPHSQLIELYHQTLPACPQVREWTEQRKAYMRSRWREKARPNGTTQGYRTVEEGLAWWGKFFAYAGESQFLTGRTTARGDRQPFVADLEWLIKPSNFAKVVEGKYHDAAA